MSLELEHGPIIHIFLRHPVVLGKSARKYPPLLTGTILISLFPLQVSYYLLEILSINIPQFDGNISHYLT